MGCHTCADHHNHHHNAVGCMHGPDFVAPPFSTCPPNPCDQPVVFHTVIVPANLGDDETYPAKDLHYRNVILVYEANDNTYIYSSDGIPVLLTTGDAKQIARELERLEARFDEEKEIREATDNELGEAIEAEKQERTEAISQMEEKINSEITPKIEAETTAREEADKEINDKIEEIVNSPDVRYIVDTYADLADLTGVGDKDYARVLQDETHEGASTYYQYDLARTTWDYVGATGPYYTKTEIDDKLDAVDHDIENLTELMPTVVQETGESETDVMSQKAVTEALSTAGKVYDGFGENTDGSINQKFLSEKLNGRSTVLGYGSSSSSTSDQIAIGREAYAGGDCGVFIGPEAKQYWGSWGIAIGYGANIGATGQVSGDSSVAIGTSAKAKSTNSVLLGRNTQTTNDYSGAIGAYSTCNRFATISFGSGTSNTSHGTRYLANVRAGTEDTDAVNVAQLNEAVGNINTLLETLISGEGAK